MADLTLSGNEITDLIRALGVQGDGRATPDSSMGIWEATTNSCTNGGFETNTTGWMIGGAGGTPTFTRVTTDSKFGSACGRFFADTGSNGRGARFQFAYGLTTQYTVSFWYKAVQNGVGGTPIIIGVYDSPQKTVQSNLTTTVDGVWRRASITFTTDGTSQATSYLEMRISGTVISGTWEYLIDGVQIEAQPLATPYVHTNGGTATRAAARVQAPTTLLNETQGWWAMRVRMGFGNTAEPQGGSGFDVFAQWGNQATDALTLMYREGDNSWRMRCFVGGAAISDATFVDPVATGDLVTVIGRWTATATGVSVDGAAFATSARASVPALADTTFDIGSALGTTQHADSDFLWFACGTGALTDADAAAIHARGNADVYPEDFPGGCTVVWLGNTATYFVPGERRARASLGYGA